MLSYENKLKLETKSILKGTLRMLILHPLHRGLFIPVIKIKVKLLNKKTETKTCVLISARTLWAHLESNQAPTDYESVALTE